MKRKEPSSCDSKEAIAQVDDLLNTGLLFRKVMHGNKLPILGYNKSVIVNYEREEMDDADDESDEKDDDDAKIDSVTSIQKLLESLQDKTVDFHISFITSDDNNSITKYSVAKAPGDHSVAKAPGDYSVAKAPGDHSEDQKLVDIGSDVDEWFQSNFDKLYQQATPSSFGDLTECKTVYDTKIRSSRELTSNHFIVPNDILTQLTEEWKCYFNPEDVTIQPYKLLLYGKDDHFTIHRDTPEPNLVGSIVWEIARGDVTHGGRFELLDEMGQVLNDKQIQIPGRVYILYPHIQHRFTRVEEGFRVAVSFKVIANNSILNDESEITKKHVVTLNSIRLQEPHQAIGVLLSQLYSSSSSEFIGLDNKLVTLAKHLCKEDSTLTYKTMPVSVRYKRKILHYDCGDDKDRLPTCVIRLLNQDVLNAIQNKKKPKNPFQKKITFFGPYMNGQKFYYHEDEGAEHMGNECRDGDIDCIYVNHALVICPKLFLK